jgi:tetratricopeptide (TPR) repeat protein
MICTVRSAAVLIIFLLAFGAFCSFSVAADWGKKPATPSAAPEADTSSNELNQNGPHLTLWQARKIIVNGLRSSPFTIVAAPSSFRFSFDAFEFNATAFRHKESEHYQVDLKTLPQVIAKRGFAGVYRLKDEAGNDLPEPFKRLWWNDQRAQQNSEALAKALNRLREMAGEQGMALRNFRQAAEAWRALSPKPPIPEEVRAQRLLAETAFKEGSVGKALYHYESGVELYPVWPEGHFNAALVAAELKYYDEAVEQMRAYLELVPDSPDAPSARDQIVIWQDKATEKAAESTQHQPQARHAKGLQ